MLNWSIAGIGIAVALWLLRSYDWPFKKWLAVGIAAIGFLPTVVGPDGSNFAIHQ